MISISNIVDLSTMEGDTPPARRAITPSSNTQRPRRNLQRRAHSVMSNHSTFAASPLSPLAINLNGAPMIRDYQPKMFSNRPMAKNAGSSSSSFESDEDIKAELDIQEDLRQSGQTSLFLRRETATFGSSSDSTLRASQVSMNDMTPTRLRRTSSVSSSDSFTTTYEPPEDAAAKLKEAKFVHNAIKAKLELAQQRVLQLEGAAITQQRKLDEVFGTQRRQDQAHSDELAQLQAQMDQSLANHSKGTDGTKKETTRLQIRIDEAAATHEKEKIALSDEIADLQAKLEMSASSAAHELEIVSKELSAIKSQLRAATEHRDSLIESSSQIAKNNNSLLENAALLEKRLKENNEANSLTSAKMFHLKKINADLSEELIGVQSALEKVTNALEAARGDVTSLKDGLLNSSNADMERMLERLQKITAANRQQLTAAEALHLQSKIGCLEDARNVEVQMISHLLKENEILTTQISTLQAEITNILQSSTSTSLQMCGLQNEEDVALGEVAVLRTQLAEAQDPLDVAQKQILRLEQDKIDAQMSGRPPAEVDNVDISIHEANPVHDNLEVTESGDDTALLSQIATLTTLLENEQAAHQSCKSQLTCSESSLRNVKGQLKNEISAQESCQVKLEASETALLDVQKSLEKMTAAHRICKGKLDTLRQRKVTEQTSSAANLTNLQASLEKEQSEHQNCKARVVRAERDLLASRRTVLELERKTTQLEDQIEIREPLVQTGILARQIWWELAKQKIGADSRWYNTRGIPDFNLVRVNRIKLGRPDMAADISMFLLRILTSHRDEGMFLSVYRQPRISGLPRFVLPTQLSEIETMSAILRDRCRTRAFYRNEYTNSAEFKDLFARCKETFERMVSEAGTDENVDSAARKAVRNAFDNNVNIHAIVVRMRGIFESAISDFQRNR